MKKLLILISIFSLFVCHNAFAVDGARVIEGIMADSISTKMLKGDTNTETLSGAKTLTTSDLMNQIWDPDGSDRDGNLPAEADSTDLKFYIYNNADGAGEDIVVKNDGGSTIVTLAPGMGMMFTCDGTDWVAIGDNGIVYDAQADTITSTGSININDESSTYQIANVDVLRVNYTHDSIAVGDNSAPLAEERITAVGTGAGDSTTGYVSALGFYAGKGAGGYFAAVGTSAGYNAGGYFSALGHYTAYGAGSFFSAVGYSAGNGAGNNFTANGYSAGKGAGDNFIAIGYQSTNVEALTTPADINNSIAIGYQSAPQYDGHFVLQQANINSNPLIQGNLSSGDVAIGYAVDTDFSGLGGNGLAISGNVGIGTTDTTGQLTVKGTSNDGSTNIFEGKNSDGDTVSYITSRGGLWIDPQDTIGAVTWSGLTLDGSELDPSVSGATINGAKIDMTGVDLTNDPEVRGLNVDMPASYSGQTGVHGIEVTGNGTTTRIASQNGNQDAIYTSGGDVSFNIAAGSNAAETYELMNLNLDATNLVASSEFHAIDVSQTGYSTGDLCALTTGSDIGVIHQKIGSYATPSQTEYAARYPSGGSWTDGIDGEQVFVADDDAIYVGSATTFSKANVDLSVVASQDCLLEFYYYDTSPAWVQFYPSDSTNGFQNDGIIQWTSGNFTNWKSDADPAGADGSAGYYIKIVRTRNNVVTPPTVTTLKILEPTEYRWDKTGVITAKTLDASDVTDTNIPYMQSGAAGFGDSPLTTDGTDVTNSGALNNNGVLTINPDGTNEVFQVNDGSVDFTDGNAGTAGTLTVASDGDVDYNKNIYANNAAGPGFMNEAATTTNPTLIPNKAEEDTGIGWASDTLHFVLGGVDEYAFSTTEMTAKNILTVSPDGTNETFQVNDGTVDFSDGNAGTAGTATVDSSGNISYNKNFTSTGTIEGSTLTEGGNAVPNATDGLDFFAPTTSAELLGVLSDETGSGLIMGNTAPSIADGSYLKTDEVRAYDGAGLKLYDDGGNGIFVEDGGNVTMNSASGDLGGGVVLKFFRNDTHILGAEDLGKITFGAADGGTFEEAAYIKGRSDGTWTSSYTPSQLCFYTTDLGSTTAIERMQIQYNGYVGIGMSTPFAPLAVQQSSGDYTIGMHNATDEYTDGGRETILIGRGKRSSYNPYTGAIVFEHDGTSEDDKSRVRIMYNDGSEPYTLQTAMTIKSSGNVGIGTTTPGVKLEVQGDALLNGDIQFDGSQTIETINGGHFYLKAGDQMMFYTYLAGGGGERMRIDGDGNVGIGTTSPGYELEVSGDIYASGDVSALTFTDRTPYYEGDALAAISKIKGVDGEIDHASLPEFAQGTIKQYEKETILGPRVIVKPEDAWEEYTATETIQVKDEKGDPVIEKTETVYKAEDGKITTETKPVYQTVESQVTKKRLKENVKFDEKTGEFYTQTSTVEKTVIAETPGRDLGAMISVLTKAVQQLTARIEALEAAETPVTE